MSSWATPPEVESLSHGDRMRLARLREIKALFERKQHATEARAPALRRPRKPSHPEQTLRPAISPAALRRGLALSRARAQRAGNAAKLNVLRTGDGAAAFERQMRIRAYAKVQRRLNGIVVPSASGRRDRGPSDGPAALRRSCPPGCWRA